MQKEIKISTKKSQYFVDITDKVKKIVAESKCEQGLCSIYVMHTTAAIIINENYDPNLELDIRDLLEKIIPSGVWRHDRVDEDASAHIKAAIIGPSQTIPIAKGKLMLGKWQAINLAEFDGPRKRIIVVSIFDYKGKIRK